MTRDEYNLLFHKLELNRVAFKRLMDCDGEVLKLVNAAIEQERKKCAHLVASQSRSNAAMSEDTRVVIKHCAKLIRSRK